MRILLVSPKRAMNENERALERFFQSERLPSQNELYVGAGLGLLILAAMTPADIAVQLIDESFKEIDYRGPYDLVAISAMTCQAMRAYEIAGTFRSRGVKVLIGGIHATLVPEEVSRYCDAVAVGEGELIWGEILSDLRGGRLKPIYRAEGVAQSSPVPRYDLLRGRGHEIYWLNTTRGCPFSCVFCCSSRIFGSKYRFKPVDQVIAEVEAILAASAPHKPRLVCFADDNMFVDRKRARELALRLLPYKIKWFAQSDLSVAADEELLELLKESGCAILFMGLETLGASKLRRLGNHLKANAVPNYAQVIRTVHEHGIAVMGAFILGLDEDTPEVFDELIAFVKETHLVALQLSILTPMPGTPLRTRLAEENRLLPADWGRHSMTEVTFVARKLTREQLSSGYLKVYREGFNAAVLSENRKNLLKLSLERARRIHRARGRSGPPSSRRSS